MVGERERERENCWWYCLPQSVLFFPSSLMSPGHGKFFSHGTANPFPFGPSALFALIAPPTRFLRSHRPRSLPQILPDFTISIPGTRNQSFAHPSLLIFVLPGNSSKLPASEEGLFPERPRSPLRVPKRLPLSARDRPSKVRVRPRRSPFARFGFQVITLPYLTWLFAIFLFHFRVA